MKLLHNKGMAPTDNSGQRMKHVFIGWVVSICWKILLFFLSLLGCGTSEVKAVDIYPEDMCSQCRMAISDQAFAAEIVAAAGEIFKFDEIGCMERFQEKNGGLEIAATFVKDYATKTWLPLERSVIIQTSLKTPMGSGKIAFADSIQARMFLQKLLGRNEEKLLQRRD